MRIPSQVTRKQGRWLDIILYAATALMLAPLAIGLAPAVSYTHLTLPTILRV